jgi:hypothetical protein
VFYSAFGASDWIAISSGLIALIALITTLWQARLTREHNYLSSRPVLDIDSISRPDKDIGVVIRNCGPGPAFVSSVTATFRKTQYSLMNAREFEAFLMALIASGVHFEDAVVSVPSGEGVIASGQDHQLFIINQKEHRQETCTKYRERMHEVRLEILYKSLYLLEYRAIYDSPVVNCT